VDANDALRRYLEQRRELGESELVLDSLSVDDAMKLLGAAKGGSRRNTGSNAVPASSAPSTSESGDWRAAVRAAGGEPADRSATAKKAATEARKPEPAQPTVQAEPSAVHVPSTQTPAAPMIALADVPAGLVVGGASRALADDVAAKLVSIQEIANTVAKCTRCSLYASATNPVPGTGNPNADFMIVGEAPGANEDEQGVPFVGQAGQLLTKIIAAINLTRDDVFIANVLKHRPPGNRNPLPEEVQACSPYLVRQIELVRPKVILALGTFAAQTLLETKTTIGKLRGQIHRYYGVPLIVTYHPAALLRNPAWKRPTWEDVQLARRILDQ
jgi:uracil-DNA glycosylase family 4